MIASIAGRCPWGYGAGAGTPSIGAAIPKSNPAAAKLAQSVDPGLVDITTNIPYQGASAAGTGIEISANGLVLTNNHVIEGVTSISARDVATNVVYTAKIVGYSSSADVAVLQLTNVSGLQSAPLGNSANVKSGQQVVGVGNAGGVGATPSYAAGTVVALGRSLSAADPSNPSQMEQLTGMIETNANVLPGDSGGPLVNVKGKVIGMDTAGSSSGFYGYDRYGSVTAQSYAIAINSALSIAKSIEKGHSSSFIHVGATAYLGIEVAPSGSIGAGGFDYDTAQSSSGITIAGLVAGSPAASSALTVGDVVTSADGHAVSTIAALSEYEATMKVGAKVTIGYTNTSGVSATVAIRLAAGPPQ
ncbi:MAG: trypsin-like serine protease [Acidimicrobiaceae bacterium]|nr:trypsin-like serine protease [Acidimicrobiaceae bacterium]